MPYMNKEYIKRFVIHCVSALRSGSKKAAPEMGIEMPRVSNEYQVTVDQALRDATATTVV